MFCRKATGLSGLRGDNITVAGQRRNRTDFANYRTAKILRAHGIEPRGCFGNNSLDQRLAGR